MLFIPAQWYNEHDSNFLDTVLSIFDHGGEHLVEQIHARLDGMFLQKISRDPSILVHAISDSVIGIHFMD
jgi:hypothetical protein